MKLWLAISLLALASVRADDLPFWGLGPFVRARDARPILAANTNSVVDGVHWESGGVYSPTVVLQGDKLAVLYAALDAPPSKGGVARIGLATGADGTNFVRAARPVLAIGNDKERLPESPGGCAMPRVVETDSGAYVMTYVQRGGQRPRLAVASSTDLVKWEKHGPAFADLKSLSLPPGAGVIVTRLVNGRLVAVKLGGRYWMYWGEGDIRLAVSTDLLHWSALPEVVLAPRPEEFDSEGLLPGAAVVTERGLLLFYSGRSKNVIASGQALFDPSQPGRLLLRAKAPALRPETMFERSRRGDNVAAISGLVPFQKQWLAVYAAANGSVGLATFNPTDVWTARNPGLTEPQDPATLPTAKTPPSPPRTKTVRVSDETRADGAVALRAGWRLAEAPKVNADGAAISKPGFDDAAWWPATVPGTVLTTLVDQGVHPDPYYGLNNMAIPETLNKQPYWYRLSFRIPPAMSQRKIWLQFDGINYRADFWLNGAALGSVTGAFMRAAFDVSGLVTRDGENVLAVKIAPPPHPGIPHEQSLKAGPGPNGGQLCKDGPTFVCTEGWDWIPGIRDRCAGIWQDVLLRGSGPVTLSDPQVVTRLPLPELAPAEVFVSIEAVNHTDQPQSGLVRGSFEGATFEQKVALAPREKRLVSFAPETFPSLRLSKPRLWWPNGYGKQELYRLNIAFLDETMRESDRRLTRFGIRELSYELTVQTPLPDWKLQRIEYTPTAERQRKEAAVDVRHDALWPTGFEGSGVPTLRTNSPAVCLLPAETAPPHLVIKVNGQRIFIRGGNWGMDDALKRVSREKLEPYIRLHRDANLTMIRNWVGQSTSDTFYELCDEYGLLVWSDFWLSTVNWNLDPDDNRLFLENAANTIRRHRNHPSLAIWCGRNEGIPSPVLNEVLWQLIHEMDGTRYYQPDSRRVSAMPSGPWDYRPPDAYARLARGFNSELGTPSVPEAEVMRSFIPPSEQWPISDTWAYHDWHISGGGNCWKYYDGITARFGPPANLDDFCRKAQMVNYESHRAMFEAWNTRLWKPCSGLLAWMSHPSWPSLNWQFYTWDYDTHASYHAVRKACEPVHIQLDQPDGTLTIVNTTLAPLKNLKTVATAYSLQAKPLANVAFTADAPANAAVTLGKAPAPPASTNAPAYLLRLKLLQDDTLLSQNDYWLADQPGKLQQLNLLPPVTLQGRIKTTGNLVTVHLNNTSVHPALMIRLTLRDSKTGERILPVFYSDNYFTLLPGDPRVVTIESPKPLPANISVTVHGWNIQPATFQ